MLKKLLLSAALVSSAQFSYSDSLTPYYGYTGNAAISGHSWNMDNVFPSPPGLDVNAVIYNYTIQKQIEDSVTVNVQNENANGTGYIFRETDEWKPGSIGGTQINKVIGLPNIPREYWGNGEIAVEGNGSVTDANVVYSYRVDPCYDPQFDPGCPGYVPPTPPEPPVIDVYNALEDENVDKDQKIDEELIETDEEQMSDEEKKKQEEEEEKDSKERLEKALAAADNSALFANALAASQMLDAMNANVNISAYVAATIDGGTYNDSVVLDGGNIPDNPKGRRYSFSTQKLHDELVDMQYNR